MKYLLSLYQDEKGQSTTEYILILAAVVMVAMQFKKQFTVQLQKILGTVTNNLNDAVSEAQ